MRRPEHDTIQIVVTAEVADKIEALFAPYCTLMLIPLELLSPTNAEMAAEEDALPTYFLGLTEQGASKTRPPHRP